MALSIFDAVLQERYGALSPQRGDETAMHGHRQSQACLIRAWLIDIFRENAYD